VFVDWGRSGVNYLPAEKSNIEHPKRSQHENLENHLASLTRSEVLVCACLVGLTQPARSQQSQQAKPPAPHGVPGYLDPQTGAFTPMPQRSVENEEELAATTPTTGKFVITFTITISSSIPTSTLIGCQASAAVFDINPKTGVISNTVSESGEAVASRSGGKATCKVTIPYSWVLLNASTDTVSLGYSVAVYESVTVPANGTSPAVTTVFNPRISSQTIGVISVPATGSTTDESVNATI